MYHSPWIEVGSRPGREVGSRDGNGKKGNEAGGNGAASGVMPAEGNRGWSLFEDLPGD